MQYLKHSKEKNVMIIKIFVLLLNCNKILNLVDTFSFFAI